MPCPNECRNITSLTLLSTFISESARKRCVEILRAWHSYLQQGDYVIMSIFLIPIDHHKLVWLYVVFSVEQICIHFVWLHLTHPKPVNEPGGQTEVCNY